MDTKLYYAAPSEEAFEEMKKECMTQWGTHDNTYGYVDEKRARIEKIANVQDNFMYMLAMFDQNGQRGVISRLTFPTQQAVRERMLSGGNSPEHLLNLGL